LDETSSWLKSHEEEGTKEEFESQLKSVQKVCDPIIAKIYQKYGGNQGGKPSDDDENEEL
jgi:heat shock protein 5